MSCFKGTEPYRTGRREVKPQATRCRGTKERQEGGIRKGGFLSLLGSNQPAGTEDDKEHCWFSSWCLWESVIPSGRHPSLPYQHHWQRALGQGVKATSGLLQCRKPAAVSLWWNMGVTVKWWNSKIIFAFPAALLPTTFRWGFRMKRSLLHIRLLWAGREMCELNKAAC